MLKRLFSRTLAASGILALVLVTAASFASPISASAASPDASTDSPAPAAASPDDARWPALVQGRPRGLDAGDTNGWYVWHDDDGFHLRTTTPSDENHIFVGVFTTEGSFRDIDKTRLEDADDIRVTDGGHKLIVKFHTHDGMDGVNFHVTGDRLSFRLSENGHMVSTNRIFIGLTDAHPLDNPFTIRRD